MQKLYTLGEILRNKLLLNYKGKPYGDKGTISRVAAKLGTINKKTAWGIAKCLTAKQIKSHNDSIRVATVKTSKKGQRR